MKNKVRKTLSLFLALMMLYAAPFRPAAAAETDRNERRVIFLLMVSFLFL